MAVDDGHLRRASGLYHGVEEKLEGFDLEHHGGIRKQLAEATEKLEKLRDWQSYAVLPKKEALIKKMRHLTEHSLDPESRAQTIRDMQDEWKLLSRGLQDRQQDLWQTFHDLAQLAYEPCKEFFSEQRNLREVNLDRRKEIVEQLGKYQQLVDWNQPDIKEIDQLLQVARNDWRKYSPVDRSANKVVQDQFDAIHSTMINKLRKEQEAFKDNKRVIIEKAKTLLEVEDIKDATEQVKRLQREWKTAGIVARKDEQELWKEFRVVCDELFNRREQQVLTFKADLEINREKAELIISKIEGLIDSSDSQNLSSEFKVLKTEYESIGTLPKAHYQKLSKRFKEGCIAFEKASREAQRSAADQSWQDVIRWVRDARFGEGTADHATETWNGLNVPDACRPLIKYLENWQNQPDELHQAALHEKTIDLEILTGTDSPAEDAGIRMNLQVQRLSDGIGSSTSSLQIEQLVFDWLATGPVDKVIYDGFERHLNLARDNWLAKKTK